MELGPYTTLLVAVVNEEQTAHMILPISGLKELP